MLPRFPAIALSRVRVALPSSDAAAFPRRATCCQHATRPNRDRDRDAILNFHLTPPHPTHDNGHRQSPCRHAACVADAIPASAPSLSGTMVARGGAAVKNGSASASGKKGSPPKRRRTSSHSSSDRDEVLDDTSPLPQQSLDDAPDSGPNVETRKRILTDTIDYPRRRATIAVRLAQAASETRLARVTC